MRFFAVLAAVVAISASPGYTASDTTASALDPAAAQLAQGRWTLLCVVLLDGRPLGRLDWPFTEDELVRGLQELAAAPREGPWQLLGARVSLGEARTFAGEHVNLDDLPRPLLVLFFNPLCPPCWDALPGLVEISAEIEVVLAVRAAHALTERDRVRLREMGLRAVRDDGALAERLAARVTPTYASLDQEGGDLLGARGLCRTGSASQGARRRERGQNR